MFKSQHNQIKNAIRTDYDTETDNECMRMELLT